MHTKMTPEDPVHRYGNMLSGLWPRSKTGSLGTSPDVPSRCILQTSKVHCTKLRDGTPPKTSQMLHKAPCSMHTKITRDNPGHRYQNML